MKVSKTLYIVRHGKSSWESISLPDKERPLLPKGVRRTGLIAEYLRDNKHLPELIVSSYAVRAYETAKLIAEKTNYPEANIQRSDELYMTDLDTVLEYVYTTPDKFNSLMLVGHNPTFTNLVNQFIGRPVEWLPTSGTACFRFNTAKWTEILINKPVKVFYITPKQFEE